MILPRTVTQCAAFAALGILFSAIPAAAQSCSPKDIINIGVPNKDNDKIHGPAIFGQTFIATVSNCLAQVTVLACKSGGESGTVPTQGLIVELRETLAGSAMATATIAPGDIETLCAKDKDAPQFGQVNAVFNSQTSITAGQSYALVFYQANEGGTGSQYYKLGLQKPGAYADGQFCKYTGTSWACQDANGERDLAMLSVCTAACCTGCTYTQGYWKNHDTWPVTTLKLGTVDYGQSELVEILKTDVNGNGLVQLAHQLIAAKLNQANGACMPQAVLTAITLADALIGSKVIPTESVPTADTSALTEILDNYNKGAAGVPHCDETSAGTAM